MPKSDREILILVINVDSQVERWQSCLQQGKNHGLELTRIPAFTPTSLSASSQCYVTDGVRAVWESHMKCMRSLLNSSSRYALIMEDDFEILDIEKLKSFLRNPRVLDYDLVQFGFLAPGFDTKVKISVANLETSIFRILASLSKFSIFQMGNIQNRLRVKEAQQMPWGFTADDFQPGAHCYLVSRDLAKTVIELNNPQFLSIDDFFTAFSQMRTFKSIRARKSLVTQAPFAKWEGDRFLKKNQ